TPSAVAISPDGKQAYVTPAFCCNFLVIDTARLSLLGDFGSGPASRVVADPRDVTHAYVVVPFENRLDVLFAKFIFEFGFEVGFDFIVPVGFAPFGVAITSDGTLALVTNGDDTVSVINLALKTAVGAPIPLGQGAEPLGLAITPGLT